MQVLARVAAVRPISDVGLAQAGTTSPRHGPYRAAKGRVPPLPCSRAPRRPRHAPADRRSRCRDSSARRRGSPPKQRFRAGRPRATPGARSEGHAQDKRRARLVSGTHLCPAWSNQANATLPGPCARRREYAPPGASLGLAGYPEGDAMHAPSPGVEPTLRCPFTRWPRSRMAGNPVPVETTVLSAGRLTGAGRPPGYPAAVVLDRHADRVVVAVESTRRWLA